MRRTIVVFSFVFFLFASSFPVFAAVQGNQGLVAWWKFDEGSGNYALDSVSHEKDRILNNFKWVPGVSGTALKFDGFTTVVTSDAKHTPHLGGSFTIEAWVAIHQYPLNWVAIADQENDHDAGYFFGIDSEGRIGLQLEVWGNWEECTSSVRLPLMKWVHIVGVYDEHTGIKLYVDGKLAGGLPVMGKMTTADNVGMQIGRDFKALPPTSLVRKNVSFPALYSFDGIIDNLKIYDRAFTSQEAEQAYASVKPMHSPALKPRKWPVIPVGPNAFEAVYTKLKLYPAWDALWRTGPDSDVVVRFKNRPYKYVFWRGTNFEENLVTGNNIWFGDQSFEGGAGGIGCLEHMSDKKALHQYISVLESNPARVVLHWRYALVDVTGHFADTDPLTGWGDWADEYFYIYPDGISVRYGTVHGPRHGYSFTEPTILLPPGKKAEDYISLNAVTISNMQGQSRTYSWDPVSPPYPFPGQPAGSNIAVVNLKSTYKPFYIYEPGTTLGPYGNPPEARLLYSRFPTWNHWPVDQAPSDGRYALFPDRYASAAVMSPGIENWIYGPGPTQGTYFLFGLTDKSAAELAPLARSWLNPPQLKVLTPGFESKGYIKSQRAYLLVRQHPESRSALKLELEASNASPVYDPAIVIKNWGEDGATLKIDGKIVAPGADFKEGHIHRLGGTDLAVWIRKKAMQTVTIELVPEKH